MWFEIIPSAGIMLVCLIAPDVFNRTLNYLTCNGKQVRRDIEGRQHLNKLFYLRDRRITGSEYVPIGLESIPDLKA